MSSWICGSQVSYEFCEGQLGEDCTGFYGVGGAGAAMNSKIDRQDRTSSVILKSYDAIDGAGAATLYGDYNCQGWSGAIFSGEEGIARGFSTQDLKLNHIHDNDVHSVRVPLGYTLNLYPKNSFAGNV
jgi:hypothetical protein